jgi:hypothetical protein
MPDIHELIEQKVSSLIAKSQGTMSQADALSAVFKDRNLYEQYRRAASMHGEEWTPATTAATPTAKTEMPAASASKSYITPELEREVLLTVMKMSPAAPISQGMKALAAALRQARAG